MRIQKAIRLAGQVAPVMSLGWLLTWLLQGYEDQNSNAPVRIYSATSPSSWDFTLTPPTQFISVSRTYPNLRKSRENTVLPPYANGGEGGMGEG